MHYWSSEYGLLSLLLFRVTQLMAGQSFQEIKWFLRIQRIKFELHDFSDIQWQWDLFIEPNICKLDALNPLECATLNWLSQLHGNSWTTIIYSRCRIQGMSRAELLVLYIIKTVKIWWRTCLSPRWELKITFLIKMAIAENHSGALYCTVPLFYIIPITNRQEKEKGKRTIQELEECVNMDGSISF